MKQTDDLVQAAQEEMLVHLGELASAQPALEGAGVALGDRNTLQLTDVNRRQAVPRDPIPPELLQHVLATGFNSNWTRKDPVAIYCLLGERPQTDRQG